MDTPAPDVERLWRDFHASIHQFVLRRVRNPADADDITQRVFLNLHRSAGALRDDNRVRAWIFKASRNAIVDHFRAPAPRREVAVGGAIDLDAAEGAASTDAASTDEDANGPSASELARCLRPLIDALPAHDAEAIRLVEIDGLSQTAASRRLGISVSGMKSRVQRARARLRREVEACCTVVLDRRNAIVEHQCKRPDSCGVCATA